MYEPSFGDLERASRGQTKCTKTIIIFQVQVSNQGKALFEEKYRFMCTILYFFQPILDWPNNELNLVCLYLATFTFPGRLKRDKGDSHFCIKFHVFFFLIDTILQNISLKHTYPQLDNTQFRFLLLLDLEFLVLFGFLAISWE